MPKMLSQKVNKIVAGVEIAAKASVAQKFINCGACVEVILDAASCVVVWSICSVQRTDSRETEIRAVPV